jgi:hypothetical protein
MGSTAAAVVDSAALGRSGREEMGATTPVVAAAEVRDSSAAVSVVEG